MNEKKPLEARKRQPWFSQLSLRGDLGLQLLALYLLFVGPVVVATLIFDRVVSRRLESDVRAADLALARAIAQETNTALAQALQSVEGLSQYPEVIASDRSGMLPLFRTIMNARPDINLVYRLDKNGTMYFHYPTGPGSTIGDDFSFRDYFQRSLHTTRPLLSEGRVSPTTGQAVTTAVMPIYAESGEFLGLVATNIRLESLSQTLRSIVAEYHPNEGIQIIIVDSAGRIIAHPDSSQLLQESASDLPQAVQSVLDGAFGDTLAANAQGVETLYSYVPIPSAGWGVIVSRSADAAFATQRAIHRLVLIAVATFLFFGFFFWLALSRQVIRPLERLAVISQNIGLETKTPRTSQQALNALSERGDQIGHLIRSLQRMEESIEARLTELSTLLQTSAAVVSSLDSRTVLDNILEQLEKLMDIHMCAIVAQDKQRGEFRARASRGLSKRYVEHIVISPTEPLSTTMRAIRSGEPIQVSDTETDPSFAPMRPRARSEGYRSILALPLNTKHAPPSVLLVYRPDPHVFTSREISLMENFANHAAMAIENAELFARSDMRLREQTRRLEALVQSLQDGLILEDLNGRVLYANRRISELLDLPILDITDAPVERLIERLLSNCVDDTMENLQRSRQQLQAALEGRGPREVELEVMFTHQVHYLRLLAFDVTDAEGSPLGRGQILRDITQNKEVDRMKTSLISTVSHELRTPLAAIKGYASTLLADDVQWDVVTQREFLEIISNETDRLTRLVNDLLDMSRIEAGNLTVSRTECRLEDLVERAVKRTHPSPGINLRLELPSDLPTIYVDPERIEAVLRNLLENSMKYAGEASPIILSAVVQANDLVVRVKDQGPGIPIEHSTKIFESFYRVGDDLTRPVPGAGLGLAICQGFISAHGGSIWLEPQAQGACFAFSLPLASITETNPRAA
jgi:PAS domain S-box-containing protein